jgi:hypothetical protein
VATRPTNAGVPCAGIASSLVLLRRLAFLVLVGGLFIAVILWVDAEIDKQKPSTPTTTLPRIGDHGSPGRR